MTNKNLVLNSPTRFIFDKKYANFGAGKGKHTKSTPKNRRKPAEIRHFLQILQAKQGDFCFFWTFGTNSAIFL